MSALIAPFDCDSIIKLFVNNPNSFRSNASDGIYFFYVPIIALRTLGVILMFFFILFQVSSSITEM